MTHHLGKPTVPNGSDLMIDKKHISLANASSVQASVQSSVEAGTGLAFKVSLLYVVSFLLHLPARISVLGAIRFDLVLAAVTLFLLLREKAPALAQRDCALSKLFLLQKFE